MGQVGENSSWRKEDGKRGFLGEGPLHLGRWLLPPMAVTSPPTKSPRTLSCPHPRWPSQPQIHLPFLCLLPPFGLLRPTQGTTASCSTPLGTCQGWDFSPAPPIALHPSPHLHRREAPTPHLHRSPPGCGNSLLHLVPIMASQLN